LPQTPLVRYVKIPQPLQPLKAQPPLRILGMVASPSDQDPLDVEGEKQWLTAALGPLGAQGMVKLRWCKARPGKTCKRPSGAAPGMSFISSSMAPSTPKLMKVSDCGSHKQVAAAALPGWMQQLEERGCMIYL
jgi:hypothetical protein